MSSEYKWQRRDRKQKTKKENIPRHGGGLGEMYKNAVTKRNKKKKGK